MKSSIETNPEHLQAHATPGYGLVRGVSISLTYALTLLAVAALSVGLAVYLNDAVAPSLGVQLLLWTLALAGVVIAPRAARRVALPLADRFDTRRDEIPTLETEFLPAATPVALEETQR